MKIEDLKERTTYHYKARVHSGKGEMVQKYQDTRGTWWVVLHDKARNKSLTIRPSQVHKRPPRA